MKILGEISLQPAKESHEYYTRLCKNYKLAGTILGKLRKQIGTAGDRK